MYTEKSHNSGKIKGDSIGKEGGRRRKRKKIEGISRSQDKERREIESTEKI